MKKGELVVYVPEMYDLQYAMFLHYFGETKAYIRLCETFEIKKVDINHLHPMR